MPNSNLEQLITAAYLLGPLVEEVVFVGGSVTGLLITDEAANEPRATLDVDAIVEISSYAEYAAFGERLRARGFAEDTSEDAPLCRWVQQRTVLDVMPLDEKILGFSNRWYRDAIETPEIRRLSQDLEIRVVTAPFFIATKLEAYKGRGQGDFLASHDLEDLIAVVDGRAELIAELQTASDQLRVYVRSEIKTLLDARGFRDALPGYLYPDAASQARMSIIMERLQALASMR
jgi:predicted nucleotidyltransferase